MEINNCPCDGTLIYVSLGEGVWRGGGGQRVWTWGCA